MRVRRYSRLQLHVAVPAYSQVALSVRKCSYPRDYVRHFIKGPKGPEPALGFFEKNPRIVPKKLESHVDMSR